MCNSLGELFEVAEDICDIINAQSEKINELNLRVKCLEKKNTDNQKNEKHDEYSIPDWLEEDIVDGEEVTYYSLYDEYGARKPAKQILKELKDMYEDDDTWDIVVNIVDLFEFIEEIK